VRYKIYVSTPNEKTKAGESPQKNGLFRLSIIQKKGITKENAKWSPTAMNG